MGESGSLARPSLPIGRNVVYTRERVSTMKEVGQNVQMEVEKNILTIKVDLSKNFGLSGSGKSYIIASTQGNVSVPGKEEIKVGLNVYTKAS